MGQEVKDWQITATTVKCDLVHDLASIMVHPDGAAKCSYVNRHSKARDSKKRLQGCKWPDCPLVADFRQKALEM